jgi:hypothetical protein
MAKKAKKEAKILNSDKETAVDAVAQKDGQGDWNIKDLTVESKTKLEDDKGVGEALTLRFFDFQANPEMFRARMPSAQELFQSHIKQIELELWKDEWRPVEEVSPRLLFAKDKSHYRIVIAARPAKGSQLSYKDSPLTLSELAHDTSKDSN